MELENTRDLVMYATIFGTFAFAWFGWAQENPPEKLRVWLGLGSIISLMVAALGGYLAYTNWHALSALNREGVYELFGIVVATEIVLAFIGSIILMKRNRNDLIASWVAFVVAIHFIPLAVMFQDSSLYILSALIVTGIILLHRVTAEKIKRNTMTCIFTACVLLVFAVRGLLIYLY